MFSSSIKEEEIQAINSILKTCYLPACQVSIHARPEQVSPDYGMPHQFMASSQPHQRSTTPRLRLFVHQPQSHIPFAKAYYPLYISQPVQFHPVNTHPSSCRYAHDDFHPLIACPIHLMLARNGGGSIGFVFDQSHDHGVEVEEEHDEVEA